MKITILKKLAVVLITLNMYAYAEDTVYLKNIDNFTLQEVKEYLITDQKSMEEFIALAENNNLRFTISTEETTRPSFNDKPYKILDTNASKVKIDKFLSDMYMRQTINFPSSYVQMHLDSDDMVDIFGAEKHSKDFPEIYVQRISYADKSQVKINRKAEWEDYNDLYVEVNSSKPIESMGVKISYTLPLVKEYFISKKNPIVLKEGTIKLENMAGGRVQLSMSTDALKEHIIVVDAIHSSAKSLRKSGESMYSYPSKANIAYMKKTNILLKKLIGRIDNKSMFDALFGKKSIESKEELEIELKKIPKPTKEEEQQKSFWTYNFAGDIEKVRVVVRLGRTEVHTKELGIKKHPSMYKSSLGYYKARDAQTKKEGFVGKDGKWLIQPKHENLSFLNDYYYRATYKDDAYHLHRLNTKKNILEPVDYLIYRDKLIDGELLMTEKIRNNQRGVVNAKTGKIVVPMKYANVVHKNGFFIADIRENEKYYVEVFNKKGKRLIKKESKYTRVKVFDVDCMAATCDGEYQYDDKIDIVSKNGKMLSKGKWNKYHGVFGKSKLLLVERWKKIAEKEIDTCSNWSGYDKRYYCANKVAFINPKGKVVIDASKYDSVEKFSNGMAAVKDKKTKLWGYINTKGKLVIPYGYEKANYFQEKYAYVEKNDKAFLIDRRNHVHLQLPNEASVWNKGLDSNTAVYSMRNGKTYNANGIVIKKKEED